MIFSKWVSNENVKYCLRPVAKNSPPDKPAGDKCESHPKDTNIFENLYSHHKLMLNLY